MAQPATNQKAEDYDPALMYGATVSASQNDVALPNGQILVGNSSGVGAAVTASGDVTITNAGVTAVGANKIFGSMHREGKSYDMVAVLTNTTIAQNVFGAGGAPCALTVTGMLVVAKDTNAANIILKQAGNIVCTAAKGTTIAQVTGGTAYANTVYAAGDTCTVESSSATADAVVFITFTVA